MASIIKTDNIQNTCGANIINQCGTTVTLGASGDSIVLGAGATASGFGRTGGVNYCTTTKTTPFTAVNGSGYFINTTCGAVTVTLPASPSAGAIIALKDYASTWQTNNVTLCNNGSKINGVCATASLSTQGQSVTLIYVDATKGWQDINDSTSSVTGVAYITATGGTITTCGDYKTHIFTSDGCFVVSTLATCSANNKMDYFVLAGGGAANNGGYSGGSGAGGFRVSNELGLCAPTMSPLASATGITATTTTYPITVGAGGTSAPNPCGPTVGSNSIFSTITSAGGGRSVYNGSGTSGGSGAGGSGLSPNSGGTGNTPPVSPPQGNPGGNAPGAGPGYAGAGGGGAGNSGCGSGPNSGGAGGIGSYIAVGFINPTCAPSYGTPGPVGSTRYFAGGGGGAGGGADRGVPPQAYTPGPGGSGGGGAGGADANCSPGISGTANTGGGGGGSSERPGSTTGGSGGSGIVMIRYKYQ